MGEEGLPWCRLPTGEYLRNHPVKAQASLKPDLVATAVSKAIRCLREDPGTNLTEARDKLLVFLAQEVRAARATSSASVRIVGKLPRTLEDASVPPASAYITETAKGWLAAKSELSRIREAHIKTTGELHRVREDVLANADVTTYLRGVGGAGQPVTLTDKKGKFKLRHSVSTRRKPMREVHVQDALRHAVETTLVDANSVARVEDMTELIMKESVRLAGTETHDVFPLAAQRGRKRAAEDE